MFNSKRIAALEKRIRDLESETRDLRGEGLMLSSLDNQMAYCEVRGLHVSPRRITVRQAIGAILDHIGAQLKFVDGAPATPERLVLQKKPKKGAK